MLLRKDKENNSWKVVKRLAGVTHKIWLILTMLVYLTFIPIVIFVANSQKGLVDAALEGNMKVLVKYLLLAITAMLCEVAARMLRTYTLERYTEYSACDIRQKTVENINLVTVSHLDHQSSGELLSRATNDLDTVYSFLKDNLTQLVGTFIQLPILIAYMSFVNWKLTLVTVLPVPFFMYISIKISKYNEKKGMEQQEALAKLNSNTQENIQGLTIIKSFTQEKNMDKAYDDLVGNCVGKSLEIARVSALQTPFWIISGSIPYILLFLYGGYLAINKEITFGLIVAFLSLQQFVVNPLYTCGRLISFSRVAISAARRIFEIWDMPKEKLSGELYERDKDNVISFENVSFSYDSNVPLFSNLSFSIKEGEKAALVGHSGCGKSTVLKLVTGFYQPNNGVIKLFGHELNDWDLLKVRELISVVSQDTYLFPESIYANIAYGKENASRDEVIEAAKAAKIHDFIEGLPQGYDTPVGERGVKLSGGQRQRVAIARALLKNAPFLLLDEATSALDTEREYEVQMALDDLMCGRTVLLIAHRFSTIKNVDRILVMENGEIAESGTHEELLKLARIYRQLYMNQFEQAGAAVV